MQGSQAFELVDRGLQVGAIALLIDLVRGIATVVLLFVDPEALVARGVPADQTGNPVLASVVVLTAVVACLLLGAMLGWAAMVRFQWLGRDPRALRGTAWFAGVLLIFSGGSLVGTVTGPSRMFFHSPTEIALACLWILGVALSLAQFGASLVIIHQRRSAKVRDTFAGASPF